MRLTLKSAAELIQEKRLTTQIVSALDAERDAIAKHVQRLELLSGLAMERNALLARSVHTDEIDAKILKLISD
jgi:hypothetical protein